MIDVLREAERIGRSGEPAALVTVVRTAGSTPRKPGAKMIVRPDGTTLGTVGGGRVEWKAVEMAAAVASGALPAVKLRTDLLEELGMCCGGRMELWLEPLDDARWRPMAEAAEKRDARRSVALATELCGDGSGGKRLLDDDDCLRSRRPRLDGDLFVEPVIPPERLFLFGAGHVAQAVASLAATVGFEVIVCDDDERFASPDRFPGARIVPSFEPGEVAREIGAFGRSDYVVIATRDHDVDQAVLEGLLGWPEIGHLGLVGSKGKRARFRQRILAKGICDEAGFERVRSPVGIPIGAATPAEIAVSIVAELVRVRSGEE